MKCSLYLVQVHMYWCGIYLSNLFTVPTYVMEPKTNSLPFYTTILFYLCARCPQTLLGLCYLWHILGKCLVKDFVTSNMVSYVLILTPLDIMQYTFIYNYSI